MKPRFLALGAIAAGILSSTSSFAEGGGPADFDSLVVVARKGAIFERLSAVRALARTGDPRAVDTLVVLLQSADREEVRREAAADLGDLRDSRAIPTLIGALAFGEIRNESVGWAAASALAEYGRVAVPPLCRALLDADPRVRKEAGIILGWLRDPRSIHPLIEAMADSTLHADRYARYTYGRFQRFGEPALHALVSALDDTRPWVRVGAARSLALANYRQATDALATRLSDPDSIVRYEAAVALAQLDDPRGEDVLIAALSDHAAALDFPEARRLAEALAKVGGRRATGALIDALAVDNEGAKSRYAWALGQIGDTVAVLPLLAVRDQRRVHDAAVRALGQIGDRQAVEPLIASLEARSYLSSGAIVWALGELRDPRAVEPMIRSAAHSGVRASNNEPNLTDALYKIGEPAVDEILAALGTGWSPPSELTLALARIQGMKAVDTLLRTHSELERHYWRQYVPRDAVPRLIEGLRDPDPAYRRRCVRALGGFEYPGSVMPLCEALSDQDAGVRRDAAAALLFIGDRRAVKPLVQALSDEDSEVLDAVIGALLHLREPGAVSALSRLARNRSADIGVRRYAWRASHILTTVRVPYDSERGWRGGRTRGVRARWRASSGEIYIVGSFGAIGICNGNTCEQLESGTTEHLQSVWGTSADDVFAVGERGTIVHYDGSRWSAMATGTLHDLYRVMGTATDDVFAIGWAGTILHYDGSRWRSMASHTELTLRDIWVAALDEVYVVGDGGTALCYNGLEWNHVDTSVGSDLWAIWVDGRRNLYVGGIDGTLLRNWTPVAQDHLDCIYAIWGLETGQTFFECSLGVHELIDGRMVPQQWTWANEAQADSMKNAVIADMDRRSLTVYSPKLLGGLHLGSASHLPWIRGGTLWASRSGGQLFAAQDGRVWYHDGSNWYSVKLPTDSRRIGMAGVSSSSLYALGRWADDVIHLAGSDTRNISPGTEDQLEAIWAGSDVDVFVAGKGGLIMLYDGRRWNRMKSHTERSLTGLWGATAGDIFAVGGRGTIVHYDGTRWQRQRSHTRLDLNAVWGLDERHVFAVGDAGKILRYNGKEWHAMDSGVAAVLTGIWGTSPEHLFACGHDGVIVHFDGTRWTQMYTGTIEPFHAIGGTSPTNVFAIAEDGLYGYYDTRTSKDD